MAEIFEPITLTWKGEEHTIPSDKVMQAIARIEDVITLAELAQKSQSGRMPMAKISMAYATVLRFAGAKVGDDEVYQGMFEQGVDTQQRMITAINTLLMLMMPPSAMQEDGEARPFGDPQTSTSTSKAKTPAKANGSASKKGSSPAKRTKRGSASGV